jgi:hypothetical protein
MEERGSRRASVRGLGRPAVHDLADGDVEHGRPRNRWALRRRPRNWLIAVGAVDVHTKFHRVN